MNNMLIPKEIDNIKRTQLLSYFSFDNKNESSVTYRHIWIHLQSYLVREDFIDLAYKALDKRNFFGDWMFKGISYYKGFAGEYPWSCVYNMYVEDEYNTDNNNNTLPFSLYPSWNELIIESGYDSSMKHNLNLNVPSKLFFSSNDLWWNGHDGFINSEGKSIFIDPSVYKGGPSSLFTDSQDFINRLNEMGYRLIWIMFGCKQVINKESFITIHENTFSQIANLDKKGVIKCSKIYIFSDSSKNMGFNKIKFSK